MLNKYIVLTQLYCYYKTLLRRSVHRSALYSAMFEVFLQGSDGDRQTPARFTIHFPMAIGTPSNS